jgi:hypothetical protein
MATVALKTITRVERDKEVSRDGVPRWTVTFSDGTSRRTAVDAAVSWGIGEAVFRDPMTSPVSITLDSNGDVIGVRQMQGIQCGQCA